MTSIDVCYDHCRTIAKSHYENFPVASFLIPRKLQRPIVALYAFMRTADDFADLPGRASDDKLHQLDQFSHALHNGSDDPIIRATRDTLSRFNLPIQLLDALLIAFRFDAAGNVAFETQSDLAWYTAHSAEPVGELILRLFGYSDPNLLTYSNHITSALQLLNFVQDAKQDLLGGRCYVPKVDYHELGIEHASDILTHPSRTKLMLQSCNRVERMLRSGSDLTRELHGRLRMEISATIHSAEAMIKKIRDANGDVFTHRPTMTKSEAIRILLNATLRR